MYLVYSCFSSFPSNTILIPPLLRLRPCLRGSPLSILGWGRIPPPRAPKTPFKPPTHHREIRETQSRKPKPLRTSRKPAAPAKTTTSPDCAGEYPPRTHNRQSPSCK